MDVKHAEYKRLKAFMKEGFINIGVPPEDAEISAEVLITSDLRGIDSHGVGRFKMYIDRIKAGIQLPVTNWKILKETPTTLLVDGGNGMGHVVSYHTMERVLEKAKKYGMGSAAITNSTHFGIDGYYPLMAVKENMVGFAFTNARPSIAPTFGVEPMIGTNPISMAAPTDEECPFCIDGATSISQRGKIEQLEREEKQTPEGWAIDEKGNPYTDTSQLLIDLVKRRAALLPLGGVGETLGGHKGYGLADTINWDIDYYRMTGYFHRGEVLMEKVENIEAVKFIKMGLSLYNTSPLKNCYYDWCQVIENEIEETVFNNHLNLVRTYINIGEYNEAEKILNKLKKEYPLEEILYQWLMKLYYIEGRKGRIKRIYNELCDIYQKELDLSPTERSKELFEKFLNIVQ